MTAPALILGIVCLALLALVVVALRQPVRAVQCPRCGYPDPTGVWDGVCMRCDMKCHDVPMAAVTRAMQADAPRTEVPEVFRRAWQDAGEGVGHGS